MRKFLLLFFLSFSVSAGFAQKVRVSGSVVDASTNQPLPFTNVTLVQPESNALVTGAPTDIDGKFELSAIAGSYVLRISAIGFKDYIQAITVESGKNLHLGKLKLATDSELLDEVEITGERRQVEIEGDKTIYNVAKDISTRGATAEDALKNLPSVVIDSDGSVSLRGSSNVRIFINGRQSGLAGADNAALLQQLPADAIERVEVINNPSARYDAEGSAGIINIVLKRNRERGLTGLVSLQGGFVADHSANTTLQYNSGEHTFEGGYNLRYRETPGYSRNFRQTILPDSTSQLTQDRDFDGEDLSHNISAAWDWRPTDKTSFRINGNIQIEDETSDDITDYTLVDEIGQVNTNWVRTTLAGEDGYRSDFGLNFEQTFDTSAHKLLFLASYFINDENEFQESAEQYLFEDGLPDNRIARDFQDNDELRTNWVFQLDYIRPVNDWVFEAGAKSSLRFIESDSEFQLYDPDLDQFIPNPDYTNIFYYDEQVHAGYLNFALNKEKWNYQAGLRGEYTGIRTELEQTGEVNTQNYFNLFPSAYVSYSPSLKSEWKIGVSRRINRPGFFNLNPFNTFSDPLNIRVGNPNIQPEFSWVGEIGNISRLGDFTVTSTAYNRYTTDIIQRIRFVNDQGIAVSTVDNVALENATGFEVFVNHEVTKFWRYNASANLSYNYQEGSQLVDAEAVSFFSVNLRTGQTFTLPYNLNLQANAFWVLPRKTIQGRFYGFNFIDLALQKDIMNEKASVIIRVTDVLNNRRFRFETEDDVALIDSEFYRQSRRFYIGFSYKINNYRDKRRGGGPGEGGDFDDF